MRIWSIHPKYLDSKALVALWRETLLAKHVLDGKTKGYRNHPQLDRFKFCAKPEDAINQYLTYVFKEASLRGYNFNRKKINWNFTNTTLLVTTGQINYEITHLLNKLQTRNKTKYQQLKRLKNFDAHPMFNVVVGDIEKWEIIH